MRYASYTESFDDTKPPTDRSRHQYHFKTIPCSECSDQDVITVNGEDLFDYRNGTLIQDAFPYLSIHDRERLMTGLCPTCSHKLFNRKATQEMTDSQIPAPTILCRVDNEVNWQAVTANADGVVLSTGADGGGELTDEMIEEFLRSGFTEVSFTTNQHTYHYKMNTPTGAYV